MALPVLRLKFMKDTIKLRLTFDVDIKLDGASVAEIVDNMKAIPIDALNWGNVTGETPAMVEGYRTCVEEIK
jgi:hypothetical protein